MSRGKFKLVLALQVSVHYWWVNTAERCETGRPTWTAESPDDGQFERVLFHPSHSNQAHPHWTSLGSEEKAMVTLVIVAALRFYRDGLAEVLPRRPGVRVVGVAAERDEARQLITTVLPDVVLLDAQLPGARDLLPCDAHVVVIGVEGTEDEVVEWAEAGVVGYVTRDGSLDELVSAIEAAAAGELRCSPRIAACMQRRLSALALAVDVRAAAPHVQLTSREREIVQLIMRGYSNKGIARDLGIGAATAKNHVHNILSKLRVEHRAEAAAWLRRYPSGSGSIR
jgi:DNA-binding NarL/FixJ family response regulator